MKEKAKELINELESLGTKFEALIISKGNLEEKEAELKSKMLGYEMNTKEIVNSQTDDNGKKLHSNEELRNIAVYKILSIDEEYQSLKKQSEEISKDLTSLKYNTEVVKNKLSIARTQSDLVVALLGDYK